MYNFKVDCITPSVCEAVQKHLISIGICWDDSTEDDITDEGARYLYVEDNLMSWGSNDEEGRDIFEKSIDKKWSVDRVLKNVFTIGCRSFTYTEGDNHLYMDGERIELSQLKKLNGKLKELGLMI